MGGGILAVTSPAVLPLVFGAAGAGLASYNVHRMTDGIKEFRCVFRRRGTRVGDALLGTDPGQGLSL
jgi:hypothetical protein